MSFTKKQEPLSCHYIVKVVSWIAARAGRRRTPIRGMSRRDQARSRRGLKISGRGARRAPGFGRRCRLGFPARRQYDRSPCRPARLPHHQQGSGQIWMPCRPQRRQQQIWAYQPRPNSSKPSWVVSSPQSRQKRRNRSVRSCAGGSPRGANSDSDVQSPNTAAIRCLRLDEILLPRSVGGSFEARSRT